MEESSYHSAFSSICCQQVLASTQIPPPPHEDSPDTFIQSIPSYRLNLLVTDGSGDTLYFAYSPSKIARYRIRRCNGIQLEPLSSAPINPPTTINNIRLANFHPQRGGRLLVMTGGSEMNNERGTVSFMPLPPLRSHSTDCDSQHHSNTRRHSSSTRRRARRRKNMSPANVYTFRLPVMSAWGLDVHDQTGRIAISSNSNAVLILAITTSHAFVNFAQADSSDPASSSAPVETGTTAPADEHSEDDLSTDDSELEDDEDGISNGDESDAANEQPGENGFERRFRIVPISETLTGTHKNNIPCVSFNHRGDRLSSASIDTTFAMYDLCESNEPMDMIMDLCVPRVSGRTLFQSGRPVRPNNDLLRDKPRAWAVKWVRRHGIPKISDTSAVGRRVLEHMNLQHVGGVWLDSRDPEFKIELHKYDDEDQLNIFKDREVPHSNRLRDKNDEPVLYNDNNEESLDVHFHGCAQDTLEFKFLTDDRDRISTENSSINFKYLPELKKHAAWRKKSKTEEKDKSYLLVGLEESLQLYSVIGSEHSDGEGTEPEMKLVDELDICSMGLRGQTLSQKMFTSVIEIEDLNVFVVTGVQSGVFLLRVIEVEVNSNNGTEPTDGNGSVDEERQKEPKFKARLFVEHVFPSEVNVIGTCIVERESEYRSLRSFELWILQQNGAIQCWDLSRYCDSFELTDIV